VIINNISFKSLVFYRRAEGFFPGSLHSCFFLILCAPENRLYWIIHVLIWFSFECCTVIWRVKMVTDILHDGFPHVNDVICK
jgi:hypothetical protein